MAGHDVMKKEKFSITGDDLLWKAHFEFQTSKNLNDCLSVLSEMNGTVLEFFRIQVTVDDSEQEDTALKFKFQSQSPRFKVHLFSTIQHTEIGKIVGVAGIDPEILFIIGFATLILSGVAIAELSIASILLSGSIIAILTIGLIASGLRMRNILISELRAKFQLD